MRDRLFFFPLFFSFLAVTKKDLLSLFSTYVWRSPQRGGRGRKREPPSLATTTATALARFLFLEPPSLLLPLLSSPVLLPPLPVPSKEERRQKREKREGGGRGRSGGTNANAFIYSEGKERKRERRKGKRRLWLKRRKGKRKLHCFGVEMATAQDRRAKVAARLAR